MKNGEKIEAENKDTKFKAQYLNQLSKAALFSGISAASKEHAKDDIE